MDRLFRFFAITECRVHDANSLQVRSQTTVSCSQLEYSGLLMSCKMVDWVSRGVVVSSGSIPMTFLAVSGQNFPFLVSGGGHWHVINAVMLWPVNGQRVLQALGTSAMPSC